MQPSGVGSWVRWPPYSVSAICRWHRPVGLIEQWPPTCTGSVCSQVWSGRDEDQCLQIWGHCSQPEKGGLPTPSWERVTSSSKGVQVSQSLVHEWGENGAGGQWCGHWSSEERAEPEGNTFNLLVNLPLNSHLWSWALGSDQKNEIANTSNRNELPSQGGWAQR